MNIQTVFENEFFVVVDKDAMVLTTPAREGARDLRPCLGTALQEQVGQQIYPVHRLDFEVSGLVIFAKTTKAHSQANTWFEKKDVFKTYHALSEANGSAKELPSLHEKFIWKSRLLRGKRRSYEHEIGKPSVTEALYHGLFARRAEWHCWELHPLTGRPHQLRYELSRHGFPIVGDALYGSSQEYSGTGIGLRAMQVDFARAPGALDFGLPEKITVAGLF
jgi:tRNA pseudouridine32 synthase/23S rRNA pseudouridine746 synthase